MAKKKQDPKTPTSGAGEKPDKPDNLLKHVAENAKNDLTGKNVPPIDGIAEKKDAEAKLAAADVKKPPESDKRDYDY